MCNAMRTFRHLIICCTAPKIKSEKLKSSKIKRASTNLRKKPAKNEKRRVTHDAVETGFFFRTVNLSFLCRIAHSTASLSLRRSFFASVSTRQFKWNGSKMNLIMLLSICFFALVASTEFTFFSSHWFGVYCARKRGARCLLSARWHRAILYHIALHILHLLRAREQSFTVVHSAHTTYTFPSVCFVDFDRYRRVRRERREIYFVVIPCHTAAALFLDNSILKWK